MSFFYSIRILPHQQNTGAFFVAVLEKVKPITIKTSTTCTETNAEMSALNVPQKREHQDDSGEGHRKKRRFYSYREDPFVFFNDEEPVWTDIKSFYQIANEFDPKCLLTRCLGGKKKNIYFISSAVKDFIILNQSTVKFINTGVRVFVRSDNRNMKCSFR